MRSNKDKLKNYLPAVRQLMEYARVNAPVQLLNDGNGIMIGTDGDNVVLSQATPPTWMVVSCGRRNTLLDNIGSVGDALALLVCVYQTEHEDNIPWNSGLLASAMKKAMADILNNLEKRGRW